MTTTRNRTEAEITDGRQVIATVETRNFSFTALAHNANAAKVALTEGWAKHCAQYPDAERGMMRDLILGGEVTFTFIYPGQCARDGEVLK